MLADMRGQFFRMLADAGFAGRPERWATHQAADDPQAPHNRHAGRPAVVRVQPQALLTTAD